MKELNKKTTNLILKNRFLGFTLAEVLVTLSIIGVLAAVTVPNLISSYQKTQFKVGLKKAYSALTQAIIMIEHQNGEVDALFFRDNLKNYLKYYEELPLLFNRHKNTYKTFNNKTYVSGTLFDDYTLKHPDGTVLFVNTDNHTFPVQIYVDLNGIQKGPNRLGYDFFLVIEYGKDQNDKKYRIMGGPQTTYQNQNTYCNMKSNNDKNGLGCAFRALHDKKYWDELSIK